MFLIQSNKRSSFLVCPGKQIGTRRALFNCGGSVKGDNWQGKVYRTHHESDLPMEEWHIIRDAVIKKDRYVCQRCLEIFEKSELTVHHIVPRSDGGSNDKGNLITLCHECHDFVELRYIMLCTRALIANSFEEEPLPTQYDNIPDDPLDWRQWVYGGKKNPFMIPGYLKNIENKGIREKIKLAERYT